MSDYRMRAVKPSKAPLTTSFLILVGKPTDDHVKEALNGWIKKRTICCVKIKLCLILALYKTLLNLQNYP